MDRGGLVIENDHGFRVRVIDLPFELLGVGNPVFGEGDPDVAHEISQFVGALVTIGDGECEGNVYLNHLEEGHHYIKIQDYKKIDIDIIKAKPNKCDWMVNYHQWIIDKNNKRWENIKEEQGIVGLDYSVIPQNKHKDEFPTLTRWSRLLTFGQQPENETNITLRIIKQASI